MLIFLVSPPQAVGCVYYKLDKTYTKRDACIYAIGVLKNWKRNEHRIATIGRETLSMSNLELSGLDFPGLGVTCANEMKPFLCSFVS